MGKGKGGGGKKAGKSVSNAETAAAVTPQDDGTVGDGSHAAPKLRVEDLRKPNESKSRSEFTVKLEDFDMQIGGSKLLENADLTLAFGRRYGLVAPNGCGKSTLLKQIATRQFAGIPERITIMYVEQEAEPSDLTALRYVIAADTQRTQLMDEVEALDRRSGTDEILSDAEEERRLEIRATLRAIGAYSAEQRAVGILGGLQFTPSMQARAVRDFSGGWRMRISLARALFCRPDLLLLDEPTNHLDLFAAVWLEEFLARWKKTMMVVSHDVGLLDYICTDIVQIYAQRLYSYRGNYEHFVDGVEERTRTYKKSYDKQVKEQEKLQAMKNATQTSGGGGGGGGKKKGDGVGKGGGREQGGNAARKQFQKLEREFQKRDLLKAPPKPYAPNFKFQDPGKLPYPVIQVKEVSFGYNAVAPTADGGGDAGAVGSLLFRRLEFGIDLDSRIALVGRNGVGKSTLLKLICGELPPTAGEVIINPKLRIGRFNQHFVDQLDMDATPVAYLRARYPQAEEAEVRRRLGFYGLTGAQHTTPIRDLSGGQKSRVVFTSLYFEAPHILFLDEPTNHLDIESVAALIDAIRVFPGGVVLITHNQRLIREACRRIWVVADGDVVEYDGPYEKYHDSLLKELVFDDDEDDD
jgi:ATP-binding cassette subfamily F protein 1